MAKTYPVIDLRTTTLYRRIVFGVDQTPDALETWKFTKTTTSNVTPGYPRVLRENAFKSQTTSSVTNWGAIDSWNNSRPRLLTRNFENVVCPTFLPTSIESARNREKAILRMYEEIPSVTANLALLYAERKKTMDSIAQALGGILKFVRQVRRGRVPEIFMNVHQLRTRKKFTGAWLNYTYGIAPLASDLYKIGCFDPLAQIIWVSGKSVYKREYSSLTYMAGGHLRSKMKFGLSLRDPLTATLAQAGLTNPALIAWELTPFSFIADWLVPVGPYLEMLSSTSGYNKHAGSLTEGWKYEGSAWSTKSSATHDILFKSIERNTMAFPSPPLPRLKNPYSPIHALNLLSIIHQQVREKR